MTMNKSPLAAAIEKALTEGAPVASRETESKKRTSAFDLVAAQAWAIAPSMLETIAAIARRENEAPEAVAAKLGRPLQNTRTVTVRDGVAVVPVTGPIFRYANLFTDISGATALEVLARDFNAAVNDPQVRAIVLEIDSPGGMAAGISDFAQQVRAGSEKKPVVAYGDNQIASAAYWIAAAASEIVLAKTAEVGSVGAVVGIDTNGANDGYMEIVSSQSPKKRPDLSTDEGRAQIQTRIDNMAQVFVEDVAQYRGVSVETVLADFGQGDVRMGADAVKAKMADRVSTLEEVIAGLAGSNNGGFRMDPKATANPAAEQKPVITRQYLEENHAGLVAELRSEGAAQAREEGVTAERERIQSVFAQATPGHEQLIHTLAFDGKTTGPEAAVQILAAENQARGNALANLKADAPKPVPVAEEAATGADAGLSLEERCKLAWDKDEKLRAEFGDNFSTYMAYEKNRGKTKILGGHKG